LQGRLPHWRGWAFPSTACRCSGLSWQSALWSMTRLSSSRMSNGWWKKSISRR